MKKKRPPVSDATRERMSEAHRGKKMSKETRERMSAARLGTKHSRATREKMRKSALARWKRYRHERALDSARQGDTT